MRFRILGNNVLNTMSVSLCINKVIVRTYCLFPRPICGDEVTKVMDSVGGALLEGHIIKTRLKIRVGEHIMDQCTGILEPDIILCSDSTERPLPVGLSTLIILYGLGLTLGGLRTGFV